MAQKNNPEPQVKRRTGVTWDTIRQKEKMRRFARQQKGLPLETWLKTLAIEEVNFIEQEKV